MDLKSVMNSPMMWLFCSFMVIVVVAQSVIYLREALVVASKMNISRKTCFVAMRSAALTAVGPALGTVIILIALIDAVGAPNTWMRLNDIGAARTELISVAIGAQTVGIDLKSSAFGVQEYSYALWSMAITNVGWIVVAMLLTHRMSGAIEKLTSKTDKQWVTLVTTGASIGLFSFLLSMQLVTKKTGNIVAAIAAAVGMLVIGIFVKKYPRLQEISLGIALLIGIFTAAAFVL